MENIPAHTPVPFRTDNEALALALQTVGEKCIDVVNVYTREILARIGFATARDAWKAGRRGVVTFFFEKSDRLDSLIRVWMETHAAYNPEAMIHCGCEPDEFMVAACLLQEKRKEWSDIWRRKSPKVFESSGEPVKTKDGEGYRIEVPSFKIRSIDRKSES